MYNLTDTIAAISTPIGNGGIGIIRISGSLAIDILIKIFKTSKKIEEIQTHTVNYGYISYNNNIIDEVLVNIMLAPKTYTCENVVEINCHGGIKSINLVLEAVLASGARLATPGEFTKRAFLNGRIDLTQAESVIDIINSKNNSAHKMAINMLTGNLSKSVKEIRESIILMIATIEASIDYPEHDMEYINIQDIRKNTTQIIKKLENILENTDKGKILKEGLETVILGRPNVGKSSLLNLILEEDRAIVTDIPGTTRDVLQEYVNINNIPIKIIDTAGIRSTEDEIEKIGVEKSKEYAKNADLIVMLIDGSKELTTEDIEILESIEHKNKIVIINKSDLETKVDINKLDKYITKENIIFMSTKNKLGIEDLYEKIKNLYFKDGIDLNNEIVVGNMRHKESLLNALTSLKSVIETIENGLTEDFISIDLQNAYKALGGIIGEEVSEDIIDTIFSQFCLGK